MSRENEEWVWRHSPYTGGALLLHLAMGDLANHQNANELWAEDAYLAERARISEGSLRRHRSQMVQDGYLEVVEAGGGRGKRVRVRLLKPAQSEQVSEEGEPAKPTQPARETRADPTRNARKSDKRQLVNTNQPNELPVAKATDDPLKRCAHELTVRAFEQPVKPTLREGGKGAFPAVMAIFERLLRAGKSRQEIERAVDAGIEVWTIHGVQTAIAQANPRRTTRPPAGGATLDDVLHQAVANERGATR